MDDTLTDPLTGRLLDGRYAVSARIAHGGMATVYLAMDTRLDRQVALKVMHAELARDDDFVRRFISEAKAVARLSHQNVVAVYDQGADGPFLYLAMEYVPGRTLKDVLREHGRFAPAAALDIMTGVLDGLAAAHASGIVHRDIKPENVLLTADGRVKVADFGLARAHASAAHTRSGVIIGTVAYLAPELVTGGAPIGPRSDVYSAGVLLYELLTGQQPYGGETPISVAFQHVNNDVPAPSAAVPGIPASVDHLVLSATSRDPGLRPSDAAQFLGAARRVREELGPVQGAGPVQGPRSGLTGMLGAGVQGLTEAPWLGADTHPGGTSGWPTGPAGPSGWSSDPGENWQASSHTMVVQRADAERYQRAREPFLGRWLFSRRLIFVAIAVAVIIGLGTGGWWFTSGRYTSIPNVIGDSLSAATTALSANGFQVTKGLPENSNAMASGLVVGISPSGRATKGATITIHLSAGPFTSSVPAVTGKTLAAAEAALRAAHLTIITTTKVGSDLPVGTVTGTNPAAGTSWPQTKAVQLLVAAGRPLPDFVGMQQSAALQQADADDVKLDAVLDNTSSQPQGTVISQSPAKGSLIQPGETVTITVSNGPQMISVPYVIGMTISRARGTLQAAGLKAVVSTGPDFFGLVFDESPDAFTSVPAGTTIFLDVNPLVGGGNDGGNDGGNSGGNNGGGNTTPFGGLGSHLCVSSSGFGLATGPVPGRSPARPCADRQT